MSVLPYEPAHGLDLEEKIKHEFFSDRPKRGLNIGEVKEKQRIQRSKGLELLDLRDRGGEVHYPLNRNNVEMRDTKVPRRNEV